MDLIFEDAYKSVGSRSFQIAEKYLVKMGSIFKNNALHYRVRCGSSASKGIIFYLLIGMFLIASVEKLMPEIQLAFTMFSMQQIILKNGMASAFSLEQLLFIFWQIKNDTLTGNFGFVGNKMAFTIGKLTKIKSHFITYKSNENTSYLNAKLIKTVTVNVYKSNGNRNYSYEMENVVKDSGEGRCFL